MKLCCILTNGFEEIEAIGTIAILRRGGVNIDVYSLTNEDITGRYGVTITNINKIKDLNLDNYDSLFIAGGPQYVELESNTLFIDIVKDFYNKNKIISAICAGPTILGHLGMLKNKNYTCFNAMNEDFGGNYIDKYVVRDGNLITGKSAAATIDFAFVILEAVTSKEHAEKVKNLIFYYNN